LRSHSPSRWSRRRVPVHGGAQNAAGTGTIKGHVKLTGPAPGRIRRFAWAPTRSAPSSPANPASVRSQEFVVTDGKGGLANAFVELQGTFANVPAAPKDPGRHPAAGLRLLTRVSASASANRSAWSTPTRCSTTCTASRRRDNGFNDTQPQSGAVDNFVMKSAETMLHMTCDVHSWMSA
jgi:hypothetical protein